MSDAPDLLRCPACDGADIDAVQGRGSACTPMPAAEQLRCRRCGNTGTRLRLNRQTTVRWDRGAPPDA